MGLVGGFGRWVWVVSLGGGFGWWVWVVSLMRRFEGWVWGWVREGGFEVDSGGRLGRCAQGVASLGVWQCDCGDSGIQERYSLRFWCVSGRRACNKSRRNFYGPPALSSIVRSEWIRTRKITTRGRFVRLNAMPNGENYGKYITLMVTIALMPFFVFNNAALNIYFQRSLLNKWTDSLNY